MHQIPAKSHFPFRLLFPSSYSTQGQESQKVTENSAICLIVIFFKTHPYLFFGLFLKK